MKKEYSKMLDNELSIQYYVSLALILQYKKDIKKINKEIDKARQEMWKIQDEWNARLINEVSN